MCGYIWGDMMKKVNKVINEESGCREIFIAALIVIGIAVLTLLLFVGILSTNGKLLPIFIVVGLIILVIYIRKRNKYKKIIIEAGFEDLLKTDHYDYNNMILKYVIPEKSQINFNIEERLDELKTLWNQVNNKISNEVVLNSLKRLILFCENTIKNKEYLCNCYDKIFSNIKDIEQSKISIYNGDIYLINNYDNSITYIIKNDLIAYITTGIENIKLNEYKQNYITPSAPVDASVNYKKDSFLEKKEKAEYQRRLTEYQVELIKADLHNKEEDKKHIESICKTKDARYLYLGYYLNENDKKNNNLQLISIEYDDKFFNYLSRYLPNIQKENEFITKWINKDRLLADEEHDIIAKSDHSIDGYKIIGNKEIGYIDILLNKKIKKSIFTNNIFEIDFEDKSKIIVKNYKRNELEKIKKKHKNLNFIEDSILPDDCYYLQYFDSINILGSYPKNADRKYK